MSLGTAARDALTYRQPVVWIAAALVPITLAVIYLLSCFLATRTHMVHVINGSGTTYDVMVGDRHVVALRPGRVAYAHVPDGVVEIKRVGGADAGVVGTITIETPFLSRPMLDRTFVVNPDRAAVLLWEQVAYVAEHEIDVAERADDAYAIHTGQFFYEFADIDYPFHTFPDDLVTESRGSTLIKRRIAMLNDRSPEQLVALLRLELGDAAAIAYLRNTLIVNPEAAEHRALLERLEAAAAGP